MPRQLCRGWQHGNPDLERGAAARRGLDPDLPAVLAHDAVGDGQAEPRALSHGLGGKEGIEDPVTLFVRTPGPGVGHRYHEAAPLVPRAERDATRAEPL